MWGSYAESEAKVERSEDKRIDRKRGCLSRQPQSEFTHLIPTGSTLLGLLMWAMSNRLRIRSTRRPGTGGLGVLPRNTSTGTFK